MKFSYRPDTFTHTIEITDVDLREMKKGDALDIICKLAKRITEHGNLPLYEGDRFKVEDIGVKEREFYEEDYMPEKWFYTT